MFYTSPKSLFDPIYEHAVFDAYFLDWAELAMEGSGLLRNEIAQELSFPLTLSGKTPFLLLWKMDSSEVPPISIWYAATNSPIFTFIAKVCASTRYKTKIPKLVAAKYEIALNEVTRGMGSNTASTEIAEFYQQYVRTKRN